MKENSRNNFTGDENLEGSSPNNTLRAQRRNFIKNMGAFSGLTLLGESVLASEKKATGSHISGMPAYKFGNGEIDTEALISLELTAVKVGGEIGRRINVTINNNLLVLDINQFIQPFRERKMLGGYGDYVGLGKNINAVVRLAAYDKSSKVLTLKKYLIEEIIKTQQADGYIGTMVKESRMWKLWDIHEMGYIIMGLTSDYHFFGEKRSLNAAKKLADYILERWSGKPADWKSWGHLGLESNMLSLYHETKDKQYLDFCVKQLGLAQWKIDLDLNTIGKTHMYTDIDLCLAQLDLFHIRPDVRLLQSSRHAIEFLTDHNGMVITGAAGLWESWNDDQGGRVYLGETCATAYQIRLLDRFLRMEGDSRYGDVIERIIYNALFGAQSPDGRKLRYFMPLEGDRVYEHRDTYCCPNNFRRIMSELPTIIFYRSAKGVAVNLYTTAETTISLGEGVSLKIQQQTDYPGSGNVVIKIDPSKSVRFSLELRIPAWCNKASVSVNGKPWEDAIVPGKFLLLERQWSAGDQVSLDMPMPFRLVLGRRRQAGRVAVMRGPQVFCLNPTQNKNLEKKDAADLTNFIIDPGSLKLLPNDTTVDSGRVTCAVKMGDRILTIGTPMELKLTTFPDPEGKVVYFRVPDLGVAVPDELLRGDSR
ncbi:beta-L-arabinofuranosidase domain-containing protein [Agriterribacter sp.]|uniref:beta-L-arabinofuranosidase domain-containing protein n=1 Tax=Agriterribacter sp. TaxID=2821509 RepID=UPI002BFF7D61|nr:beta-L-arabinofuranosidase domain-containing protein [Agriterribacter sp.]HTN08812.1 beta-L-arabinofuranosidase domain-containing protein [Agriterribacter sp.]